MITFDSKPADVRETVLDACVAAGFDRVDIDGLISAAIVRTKNADALAPSWIERHWYASVANGRPDFAVYATTYYIAESFACWEIYSRRYLARCDAGGVFDHMDIRTVCDLGCGVGITTAALAHRLSHAEIAGTNISSSPQWDVAQQLSAWYAFRLHGDVPRAHCDLVFASEYFEHFHDPIGAVRDVIAKTTPTMLVFANTFNSPAIGHFPTYRTQRGASTPGRHTARAFTAYLKSAHYKRAPYIFWNDRPQVWVSDVVTR